MKTFQPIKPILEKGNKPFVWGITLLAFLLPLFFIPLTTDFYLLNKTVLLYSVVLLLLLFWAVKSFSERKIELVKNPLGLPIIILMTIHLLSSLVQSPNRINSLFNQTGAIIALGLLYFIIINHLKTKKEVKQVLAAFLSSLALLAWLTVFTYLGILEEVGPAWLKNNPAWTPTGSAVTTASLMLIFLPATIFWAVKKKEAWGKTLLFIVAGLQVLSLVLIISLVIDKTLTLTYLLPQYGWAISVEGLKNLKTALLGVGPDNFLAAFSQFRPAALNNTAFWRIKFTSNSNQYLHLLSTVGLIGLISYLWFMIQSLKRESYQPSLLKKTVYFSLLASFIFQLFFNANLLISFITFVLAGLLQTFRNPVEKETKYQLKSPHSLWFFLGTAVFLSLAVFYWQSRVWLASYFFRQSLLAAQKNKGSQTYTLQVKAIKLNPFVENYRTTYANTNLALADSLSKQGDLSDQEKSNIRQLISQSIREAKAATALNPQISSHWVNLANIYRQLINLANEADQWALASSLQAVRTDPTNPLLRVDFGSLLYVLQDYDQAINQYLQSVTLKPDYANGYYNLAIAYQQKEDWNRALVSFQQTLSLLEKNTPDWQRVSQELETLKASLPEAPAQATPSGQLKKGGEIVPPQPLPSPQPKIGEIELPGEPGPEIPSPSPSSSPEASPSARP